MVPIHCVLWLWRSYLPCTNDDKTDDSHQQDEPCILIHKTSNKIDEEL